MYRLITIGPESYVISARISCWSWDFENAYANHCVPLWPVLRRARNLLDRLYLVQRWYSSAALSRNTWRTLLQEYPSVTVLSLPCTLECLQCSQSRRTCSGDRLLRIHTHLHLPFGLIHGGPVLGYSHEIRIQGCPVVGHWDHSLLGERKSTSMASPHCTREGSEGIRGWRWLEALRELVVG